MNKIVLNYLLKNFLKKFLIIIFIAYCFGLILNLFEEIEFFKNLDVSIFTPLILTVLYIPGMIINLLPFIIFISSMKFLVYQNQTKIDQLFFVRSVKDPLLHPTSFPQKELEVILKTCERYMVCI